MSGLSAFGLERIKLAEKDVRLKLLPATKVNYFFLLSISLLVTACAQHANVPGVLPTDSEATEIRADSSGLAIWKDLNRNPTALVDKVDDGALAVDGLGYPKIITVKAGSRKLHVSCRLGSGALIGQPRPFDRLDNGIGQVQGPTGGIIARIVLIADLEPRSTYDIKCASIGNYRARAWLVKFNK